MACPNCNSNNIESGISIGMTAEIGSIGPRYKSGLFVGSEQMYCDLCSDCGEIIRMYVKDFKSKKWYKKQGSKV